VERLRKHLGDNLKKTVIIGATQWEQLQPDGGLGGTDAEFFFLPTWLVKRREEWGPNEFGTRYAEAWAAFLPSVNDWMKIVPAQGPTDVEAAYLGMLEGKIAPEEGLILTLNP
jgi:hypothetical protein